MTKRAPGQFERKPRDLYSTPYEAVPALIPHLEDRRFAEPCSGEGKLIAHLQSFGLQCMDSGDIAEGRNALDWTVPSYCRQIITNPPWRREILHPMIFHFIASGLPVWLLLDADWAHTIQARPFMARCSHVVSVGRLRWEPGSPHSGLDNNAWYRFHADQVGWPHFVPRMEEAA